MIVCVKAIYHAALFSCPHSIASVDAFMCLRQLKHNISHKCMLDIVVSSYKLNVSGARSNFHTPSKHKYTITSKQANNLTNKRTDKHTHTHTRTSTHIQTSNQAPTILTNKQACTNQRATKQNQTKQIIKPIHNHT